MYKKKGNNKNNIEKNGCKLNKEQLKDIDTEKVDQDKIKELKNRITRELKSVKKIISFNNSHIYISALLLIICSFFYQLGYGFVYGYYFGGKTSMGKLMDVMVNQIPFDFKLITIIGICILIFIFCFYISLHMYMKDDKISMKFIWIFMHMITIVILYVLIVFLMGLNSNTLSKEVNTTMVSVVFASSSILFCLLIMKTYINLMVESFIIAIRKVTILVMNLMLVIMIDYNIIYWILSNYRISMENIVNSLWYNVVLFFQITIVSGLIDYCLFSKEDKKGIKKYLARSVEIVPPIILLIWVNLIGKIFLIVFICGVYGSVILNKRKNKISTDNKEHNPKESDNNKEKSKKALFILILIGATMIINLYVMAYGVVNTLGNAFGKTLSLNTKSKITYYNTNKDENYKSIYGIVVQQTGNTYYISSENRELIVITSPYVVIEPYDNDNKEK